MFPGAQGIDSPEGNSDLTENGRGVVAPGGVEDHGTHEEDGPGTWDPLVFPRVESRLAGSRGRNVSGVAPVGGGTGAAVKNKTSAPR